MTSAWRNIDLRLIRERPESVSYLCRLAVGDAIVIHDCLPPGAWHQCGLEQFVGERSWNGTVWKAVLREFKRSARRCQIVDTV